jgi:methionyl-tRNA formyltransferase
MADKPRIVFAGNRGIAVKVLDFILSEEVYPQALLLPTSKKGSHNQELVNLCSFLPEDRILYGTEFRQKAGLALLTDLKPDYLICVHFPYLIPHQVLSIPTVGVLNLHPAYLPFNRGWHTPSWAILSDTPAGGTLHFMDENIDTGDIIHQKRVTIAASDTADSLYQKIIETEFDVFVEAFPSLLDHSYQRKSQKEIPGSVHHKEDLMNGDFRKLDLGKEVELGELITKLRGLTTSRIDEAAYFELNGKKHYIQVNIVEEE